MNQRTANGAFAEAVRSLSTLAAALLGGVVLAWLASSCEQGTGQALTLDPDDVTIGPNIRQFTIGVVGGLRELSAPIKWRVSNPAMGQIAAGEGYLASYVRTSLNGQNIITATDQYGAEGYANVNQVSYDTAQPATPTVTTPTATTTTSSGTTSSGNMSVSVSGDTVTVRNLWSDGTSASTQIVYGSTPTITVSGVGSLAGESHELRFANVTWDSTGTTITGFTLVVDGTTTLSYP